MSAQIHWISDRTSWDVTFEKEIW